MLQLIRKVCMHNFNAWASSNHELMYNEQSTRVTIPNSIFIVVGQGSRRLNRTEQNSVLNLSEYVSGIRTLLKATLCTRLRNTMERLEIVAKCFLQGTAHWNFNIDIGWKSIPYKRASRTSFSSDSQNVPKYYSAISSPLLLWLLPCRFLCAGSQHDQSLQ